MRLPRRVPWASLTELDQVCSWIYADEFDMDAKRLAVDKLAAWKNITSLPHAIESTHALLSAILQDATAQSSSSYLSLRQSYATALIRLVNGLVDPLQLGAYARSIASIAAQIGLPPYLVELRHAATHEDLPSIELLRQAAREAMTWLLNNYWLPTLNPTAQTTASAPDLRPIDPLFKQYKTLLKAVTRDASLRASHQPEITKVVREVERWLSEARVAADLSLGAFDWDVVGEATDPDQEDIREKWALDRLCDALIAKGALVPQSKKKRVQSTTILDRTPANLSIWKPLVEHVYSLHPSFPSILVSKITTILLESTETEGVKAFADEDGVIALQDSKKRDLSYDFCLASWANWLVDTYGADDEEDEDGLKRENALVNLISGLGPNKGEDVVPDNNKAARLLLQLLCEGRPKLQQAAELLIKSSSYSGLKTWNEADLDMMNERLEKLLGTVEIRDTQTADIEMNVDVPTFTPHTSQTQENGIQLPSGWQLLMNEQWKAAPIGIFVHV